MPQFRANKMRVPVASDAYALTSDLAAMADSANIVIPVSSDTERNALTNKTTGTVVTRLDKSGLLQVCVDGTNWKDVRYDNPDNQMVFYNSSYSWGGSAAPWDAGTFTTTPPTDGATQASPSAAFATIGSLGGTIKFLEAGIYDIGWYIKPSADPGASGYSVGTSGTWPQIGSGFEIFGRIQRSAASGTSPFYWETYFPLLNIRVPQANLQIRFNGSQTNATTNSSIIKVYQKAKL